MERFQKTLISFHLFIDKIFQNVYYNFYKSKKLGENKMAETIIVVQKLKEKLLMNDKNGQGEVKIINEF